MTLAAKTGGGPSILLRAERAAALCAAIAMLGMMLIGTADVIGTAALNRPLPGAFELTEALMVATVFLALALSQREGRQIRVEILASRPDRRDAQCIGVRGHRLVWMDRCGRKLANW